MNIGIDNIIAAILLSLIMMRRIEVKTARADQNPAVLPEVFESWRKSLLAAYNFGALSCALKVAVTLGWQWLGLRLGVGQPWYQVVAGAVSVVWVIAMVSVWQRVSDGKGEQERLGIVLGNSRAAPR